MQQYLNEEASEVDQKVIDEARKNNGFLAVANPDAKEFEPRNKTPRVKPAFVVIKNALAIYKEKEQEVTCTYCKANALPNHLPSVWTKCKDNSDLNNSYEDFSPTMYGDSFNNAYWSEEVDHMDLASCSYDEYYPEYLTPAGPGNSSSNNVYWLEGQEVNQMDLTNQITDEYYNQTTYYSVDQTQIDNVCLEPTPEDSTSLQTSPGIWYNDTYYYNF